jgi:OOP family OmpA-OmpF porin
MAKENVLLPRERRALEPKTFAGGCGYYQSVKYLDTPQNLASWVADVFLTEVEKKAEVVAAGDSDGDGLTDDIDQCSDTPMGAPVNDRGCWLIETVYFDFNRVPRLFHAGGHK